MLLRLNTFPLPKASQNSSFIIAENSLPIISWILRNHFLSHKTFIEKTLSLGILESPWNFLI